MYEEICRDFVISDSYKRSVKVAIFSCYQCIGPFTSGMLCSKLKSVVAKFVCTVNKIKITFEFKLFSPFMEKDFGNIYTSNPLFSMKLAFVPNYPPSTPLKKKFLLFTQTRSFYSSSIKIAENRKQNCFSSSV